MKQASGWGLAKKSPYVEEFNRGFSFILCSLNIIELWFFKITEPQVFLK